MRHLVVILFVSLCFAGTLSAQLSQGDILVVDSQAGTNFNGALFVIDPVTGNRTLLSDFGDPTQGPLGRGPNGIAYNGSISKKIFVMDSDGGPNLRGLLFAVNPVTGFRTVINDFDDAGQGMLGVNPSEIDLLSSGDVVSPDLRFSLSPDGVLFVIKPGGTRTVVSDFADPSQGPLGYNPNAAAVHTSGRIFVTDQDAPNLGRGKVFVVSQATGGRTEITDFNNSFQGPLGMDPRGLDIEGKRIYVADFRAGTGQLGGLFSVAFTGQRTLLSDFGNLLQGPLGAFPVDVVYDSNKQALLVVDSEVGAAPKGLLFVVDPANGKRIVLSDFGDPAQGPTGFNPAAVEVVEGFQLQLP